MPIPSIKGTLFQAVVDDVETALESGLLSRDMLETSTHSGDIEMLEEKVFPSQWYDIAQYHRLLEALRMASGTNAEDFYGARGERAAKRLLDLGVYQQLEYLGRMEFAQIRDPEERFNAFARDMRLILTIQASMVSFGRWECVVDPDHGDRYRVEIHGVGGIGDGLFMAAVGLFNVFSKQARAQASEWTYERPEDSLVLMRMNHAV